MRLRAAIILILNTFCVHSRLVHEVGVFVGCFDNGEAEVQVEFENDEIGYADFERGRIVYTVPPFITTDPEEKFKNIVFYNNARKSKNTCSVLLAYCKEEAKHPPEHKDPPDSSVYPADEVLSGVENTLICFVNNIFPPHTIIYWTKNGVAVSAGVTLSRYYPNSDQTFHQFSALTFTPREGDTYSCTVEHASLERPKTKSWELDIDHQSLGLDVFCGVGLIFGLFGVAVGTFLFVKRHH